MKNLDKLNSVKEHSYSWEMLRWVKLLFLFPSFFINMKITTSQTCKCSAFPGYFAAVATYCYQPLSFTCLMPSDLVLYFGACSSFEAAWISKGLSLSASPLRREKYAQNFNWGNPWLMFLLEQKPSSKAETKTSCKIKWLMRLIQYNILKYDLLPKGF